MSDSLQPRGLLPTRLLCSWNFPGKNTGVGSHSLLQGIFPIQGSNPGLLHWRQIIYHLRHRGSPCREIIQHWHPASSSLCHPLLVSEAQNRGQILGGNVAGTQDATSLLSAKSEKSCHSPLPLSFTDMGQTPIPYIPSNFMKQISCSSINSLIHSSCFYWAHTIWEPLFLTHEQNRLNICFCRLIKPRLPRWHSGKESAHQCRWYRKCRFYL